MELIIGLIILVFSAIFHEVAHGFVADRLGDPTARLSGRLTLNPKSHIDPFMSILVPLLLIISGSPVIFGAAKPVPIDPFNLKDGKKDMAIVALAGPLTNIILAIIAGFIMRVFYGNLPLEEIVNAISIGRFGISSPADFPIFILGTIVYFNLLLAIFNLVPIPPLDGSKIFALILGAKEERVYMAIGSFGIFILFFLLFFPIGGFSLGQAIFSFVRLSISLLFKF